MSETDFPAPVPTATACAMCGLALGSPDSVPYTPHKSVSDCLRGQRLEIRRLYDELISLRDRIEQIRDQRTWFSWRMRS